MSMISNSKTEISFAQIISFSSFFEIMKQTFFYFSCIVTNLTAIMTHRKRKAKYLQILQVIEKKKEDTRVRLGV